MLDGKGSTAKYLNDLYTIDLKNSPNKLQWEYPMTHGVSPPPRESHSTVYFESNGQRQLIIYGGMSGNRLGDLWILDLNSMNWSNPLSNGLCPLPRSLHTANIVNSKMFVFGGWVPVLPHEKIQHDDKPEWKCSNSLAVFDVNSLTWELCFEDTNGEVRTLKVRSHWAWPEDIPQNIIECESAPCARAGHSSVVINKRVYVWSGRDGYRKSAKSQVCCNDMWYLETEPPPAPNQVQLVRASISGLEVCWNAVPTAESYLLQLQKYEPPVSSADSGAARNYLRAGASPVKTLQIQRNGTPHMMKVIRGAPAAGGRQQVLRVLPSNKPMGVNTVVSKPMQKTIIVSKSSNLAGSPTMDHNNGVIPGGPAPASSKYVFVQQQPNTLQQQQQPNIVNQGQVQQIPYSNAEKQQVHHLSQQQQAQPSYGVDSSSGQPSLMQAGQASQFQPIPQQTSYSVQKTTYTTPIISSIDQSMPHNILDEALNDAENFDGLLDEGAYGEPSTSAEAMLSTASQELKPEVKPDSKPTAIVQPIEQVEKKEEEEMELLPEQSSAHPEPSTTQDNEVKNEDVDESKPIPPSESIQIRPSAAVQDPSRYSTS
uniref:Host cell factor n=1 Tax=Ditylenchus dipsaci TaxID=166011 RepID=A0A915E149_9BILA